MTSSVGSNSPGASRLYFVDHLRAAVIVLVIVLHTSMSYMTAPPEWLHVIEPPGSLFFTLLVLLLDVPNMQILFFLAGFFAYDSLARYGAAGFMRSKLVRLGLPWLAGVVFLAPVSAYLFTLTRGIARPYLDFWRLDFWDIYFQQSVYWFLGVLLVLFALLAAAVGSIPGWRRIPRRAVQPSWRLLGAFWAVMTLWYFLSSTYLPADSWYSSFKLLVFQPARLLLYSGYFSLGVYADRNGWLRADGYQPAVRTWLPAALVSAAAYLGLRLGWVAPGGAAWLALQAALFNALCLAGLMAAVAIFHRYLNRPHRVWSSLARNSFAIYYLHPLILYPASYVMLFVETSIFVKAALLIGLTTLAAWALSAAVLTRLPVLREVF